jgi:2-polyprenyl-6-methoxyphenol hydroxylase-like FAD-dependent oxidoreductase
VHDHDPIKVWHKDNVVLLGDAAHSALPTSGQGACQALEDAWHLAKYLADSANTIDQAFALYTQIRQAKTTAITMGGRALATSIFNPDSKACKYRDEKSKQTDYQQMVIAMAKGWSSGLPLPS